MKAPATYFGLLSALLSVLLVIGARVHAEETPSTKLQTIDGWTVHVSQELLEHEAAATARALELLKGQLDEIVRVVPQAALTELRKVPLWISPEYPGIQPKAEYHPDAGWLRAHGRKPAMARAVEFTNVRIFESECRRMPMMVLHELAHAYHHRVLGYDDPRIRAAFEKAKASGSYDRVQRRDAKGRIRLDRAYALSNPQEYFAESTEAFFGTNDFFPFTREELKEHDPEMFHLLTKIWNGRPAHTEKLRKTAPAIEQAPVDFNHPPRDYVTNRIREWTVLEERQLVDEAPALARNAFYRLARKLGEAQAVLPAAAWPHLHRLKFFIMYGVASTNGGRDNGLEYFQKTAPHFRSDLDPRMASSIVIYSATNYVWLSEFWALKALVHELAHAYHLEQWPESRSDIYDAWKHAEELGLYRDVKDDQGQTLKQAYALQNHLEYFAELSCMYFVGCNYAPFNRTELKTYDPVGYDLVEKLWGLSRGQASR